MTEGSAVHFGILGGGGISHTHARAASLIPGGRIAAVAGLNAAKVKAIADQYGAAAYDDVGALLRHRPMDVLLIGSPSALHADQGIAAAHAGLHVLTEKPLDIRVAKADALISACAAASVKLGVFFQDRFAPDLVRLKAAIDGGRLGRPLLASARVKWWREPSYYAGSKWRGTQSLDGGGALINQGIHTLDLLLWLWGDVRRVFAWKTAALHGIEVEDTLVATLEFENGALATYEATTAAYPGYPRQIELTTTDGTVVVEHDRIRAVNLRESHGLTAETEANTNAAASSPVVSDVRGHQAAIEDFLTAIRTGGEPRCNGVEGRRSLALAEALYLSSHSGQPIELSTS